MTFNVQKKEWEGNNKVLKQFDNKKETILPCAIDAGESMTFDPLKMTWNDNNESDDVFADIPDIKVQQEIVDSSAFTIYPLEWSKADKNHKHWAKNFYSMQGFRPSSFKVGRKGNLYTLQ